MPSVLVVGASGLVGTAAVESFARNGWSVTAVSRRRPDVDDVVFAHLPLDLTDAEQCRQELSRRADLTHVVYAAAYEQPGLVAGWSDPEQMSVNRAMIRNVVDPLAAAGSLQHVTLMQGTKAYGVHLHRIPLPAREDAPRDPHENFYWLQEDYLREVAGRAGFDWTILRPVGIVGPSHGTAYCTPPVIGAFAVICHAEGRSFAFPGGNIFPARQIVDVRLVGAALLWAATSPTAVGEHFNLTNGEVFSWQELWPSFAAQFGLTASDPEPLRLSEFLPQHADTWRRIVAEHALRDVTLEQLIGQSHFYADYTFGAGAVEMTPPGLVSDVKIRQAGFCGAMNTEATFRWSFERLIERGLLPRLTHK